VKKLYVANDLIEARLLDGILHSRGIGSVVKNESLQGGLGELPFVEIWPEVWVKDLKDWDIAIAVLEAFGNKRDLRDWICQFCKETNPGSFQSCWSCGEQIGE
jgi:hypothetical protein